MAYPIRLFDFQSEAGKQAGTEFLYGLDKTLTELFGTVPTQDKTRKFHKFEEVPEYLVKIGEESVRKILKDLPKGNLQWQGSVGIYGRKVGSTIKKSDGLLYRLVIHLGSTEIYSLMGDAFGGEPVVLPNGWALLCSPVMIDNVDIKVDSQPIRKNLAPHLQEFVSKIRARDYMRSVIVLDLLLDGIENLDDLSIEKTCPPEIPDSDSGSESCCDDVMCEGNH